MSDSVVFQNIPLDVRTPGVYFEVDGSRANQSLPGMPRRILVIGDKTTAGSEPANTPKRILDAALGAAFYGYGSPLARMLTEVRKHNANTELWAMAGGSTGPAAQLQIQVGTLTPTAGTIAKGPWEWHLWFNYGGESTTPLNFSLLIGGSGDATNADRYSFASYIAAQINANPAVNTLIEASATNDLITITSSNSGAVGAWNIQQAGSYDPGPEDHTPDSPNPVWPDGETFSAGEGGGTTATGTITITTTTPKAGTLALYVAGRRLAVRVLTTDTDATIATRIATAINADVLLPVTATAVSGVVTLTAKWAGDTSNDCDLRLNVYPDETTPTGVTVAFVPLSGGVGAADITAMIAAIGDEPFTAIVTPWTDANTLSTLEDWLAERYGPMDPKPGHVFSAINGSLAALVDAGHARNSMHSSIIGVYGVSEPTYLWAASLAGVCEYEATIDPGRPLKQVQLNRLAPAIGQRLTRSERETLLHAGISTFTVNSDGSVFTERVITTYQTNSLDVADTTWLALEKVNTVDAIRYAVRYRIASKFPRMKLAIDGTQFAPGQPIVTPSVIRAEMFVLFREMEAVGWVQNFDQFKADLRVEISQTYSDRVNVIFPPELINQLNVVAGSIQPRM